MMKKACVAIVKSPFAPPSTENIYPEENCLICCLRIGWEEKCSFVRYLNTLFKRWTRFFWRILNSGRVAVRKNGKYSQVTVKGRSNKNDHIQVVNFVETEKSLASGYLPAKLTLAGNWRNDRLKNYGQMMIFKRKKRKN